ELFEIDLPASRTVKPWTSPAAQQFETENSGEGSAARTIYRWKRVEKMEDTKTDADASTPKDSALATSVAANRVGSPIESDVILTSFASWADLARALQALFAASAAPAPEVRAKAEELTRGAASVDDKFRALYDFVSQKLSTVDLPLGSTSFLLRSPAAILPGTNAIPEEKCSLLY